MPQGAQKGISLVTIEKGLIDFPLPKADEVKMAIVCTNTRPDAPDKYF